MVFVLPVKVPKYGYEKYAYWLPWRVLGYLAKYPALFLDRTSWSKEASYSGKLNMFWGLLIILYTNI